MNSIIILINFLLFLGFESTAQDTPSQVNELFRIERSRSSDDVVYAVNLDDRFNLDKNNPMNVYWQCTDCTKPLSFIQNKYSYGIKLVENSINDFSFLIKALPSQVFEVKKKEGNTFHVYTIINNSEAKLENIFIQFKEGTTWTPDIEYIQLEAENCSNKELITKIIKPE